MVLQNGILVIEGDVVTGNASRGSPTPTGVYRLNYKQKDATLKGENYSSSVSFWMPFMGMLVYMMQAGDQSLVETYTKRMVLMDALMHHIT